METYSLIQPTLGTTINRTDLEEASVAAPSVGKVDCARIAKELFGIVVSGIPIEDAIAFRAALMARDFPTLIAADSDIPRLPDGHFYSQIDTNDETCTVTDTLGQKETFRGEEVLLLAAGFLQHQRSKTELKEVRMPYYDRTGVSCGSSASDTASLLERQHTLVQVPEFRFECFIKRKPYRLRIMTDTNTNFTWNGHALRLGKPDPIHAFLKTWHRYVPETQWNLGLQRSGSDFQYPSLRAFENEIRWRFHQLKQEAKQR